MALRMTGVTPADFPPGEVITLRPGVVLPGWQLVPDETGQQALRASMAVAGRHMRWAGISAAEDRVWRAVLRRFAGQGRAPAQADLLHAAEDSDAALRNLLQGLARRDLLVLDAAGAVVAAYPFSAVPTLHRVALAAAASVYALCAIDALGMGGMLGQDSVIRSRCPQCGGPIVIETRDRGLSLASVRPASAMVWSGIHYAGGCAATSGCAEKLFFCSDTHFEPWHAGRTAREGFRLTVPVAQQVGLALFVPMLASGEEAPAKRA